MYRESLLTDLFTNQRILIAGMGREGNSVLRLADQLPMGRTPFVCADGNEQIRQLASQGFDKIIKSPGIPMSVFDGICDPDIITSTTDLFLQVFGNQTIGITGTKGKSTTTSFIADVLGRTFGSEHIVLAGNIGIPLFDIIPQLDEQSIVVAELSCHQLENIHRAPHVSLLLNLFQEHLDHYRSYRNYQLAKLNIALKQQAGDYFYYCTDNAELKTLVEEYSNKIVSTVTPYGINCALANEIHQHPHQLSGEHNISNMVAAHLLTLQVGAKPEDFWNSARDFKGLEHRLECVGTYDDITFYNDSISTIPAACMAAVLALKEVDTIILGGFDRGIDYTDLGTFLAQSGIRNMAFVGEAGNRIYQKYLLAINEPLHLTPPQMRQRILIENDYQKIVAWCFEQTEHGKICLLSPAAASYDAFKNFEERGSTFKNLIRSRHQNSLPR